MTFGEYSDFKPLREILGGEKFESLLFNESLSIFGFILFTLRHSFFWGIVLTIGIYFGLRKRLGKKEIELGIAIAVPVLLLAFEIIKKLVSEDLI